MNILKYSTEKKNHWDSFVNGAKNKHFFFLRDYMDYHSHIFNDNSLMVYDDQNKLIALFPANQEDGTLYSHQGLTFGGFLVDDKMKAATMLEVFDSLIFYCSENGFQKVIYKCIPFIYCTNGSDEDKYALFRNNSRLLRRDISTTIFMDNKLPYQEQRRRAVKKAQKNNLVFSKSEKYFDYWEILNETLKKQHNTQAVHSFEEIISLKEKFPNNIKLFIAELNDKILGGTLVFENDSIVHTQYLANSEEGREVGALDFVIDKLVNEVYSEKKYFDFGISNEQQGKVLNTGLIAQKEGFGARAVAHDFYELRIN